MIGHVLVQQYESKKFNEQFREIGMRILLPVLEESPQANVKVGTYKYCCLFETVVYLILR